MHASVRERAPVRPALVLDRTETRPRAAVLVLHGGSDEGEGPPPRLNVAAGRMRPVTRGLLRATEGLGVVVGRVRYRCRGWNGARADAARDTLRALDELGLLLGRLPVVLVGHSMGGRAALSAGGHDLVEGVVALAPWCPPGEPVHRLAGRRAVLLHGERDRTTDPRESVEFAARARRAGARACAVLVARGEHTMLRRAVTWQSLTVRTVEGLLGAGPLPDVVRQGLLDDTSPVQRA
ncbi:alpha/beta hydrolase [Streptomyces montanisoli]|uniref:Alpha/beta hydrolase n=1 Tax=Streptomyces montanisoli TaxID=2798581 RepID=A0A940MDD3_9ACTN|nr:alpha/beta fold hydrolase [Streptomyces montanisoli]MBP0460905.1 alpha/beta hydrolase [Streptomyces montanisoli]